MALHVFIVFNVYKVLILHYYYYYYYYYFYLFIYFFLFLHSSQMELLPLLVIVMIFGKDTWNNLIHSVISCFFCFFLFFFLVYRNACDKIWGEELKELIEERGKRGKLNT